MKFAALEIGRSFVCEGRVFKKVDAEGAELAIIGGRAVIGAETDVDFVLVTAEPDDPTGVLRASIGGTEDIGYYCLTRGDRAQVVTMLDKVLTALKAGV